MDPSTHYSSLRRNTASIIRIFVLELVLKQLLALERVFSFLLPGTLLVYRLWQMSCGCHVCDIDVPRYFCHFAPTGTSLFVGLSPSSPLDPLRCVIVGRPYVVVRLLELLVVITLPLFVRVIEMNRNLN